MKTQAGAARRPKTRVPTDAAELVRQAKRFGRLREVTPRQAAIVRAAAVYDRSVLPQWQRPGKGVNSELEDGAYSRGVTWVRTKNLCHGARGTGWRMERKQVVTGQPHLAWLSREHWLMMVANAAIQARPELLRNGPDEGRWSVSVATFMLYLETVSLYADQMSGRDLIVRPITIAKLMEVNKSTVERCQRIAEALGLLVVLAPGDMLKVHDVVACRQGGSKQRGLANHSALVVPRWLDDAEVWAARPETPQTVSQAVHGAPSAPQPPSEAHEDRHEDQAGTDVAAGGTATPTPRSAEPVDNSTVDSPDQEGCATPTRGPVRVRSTRTHPISLRPAHSKRRGFAAGEKAPPPAALAPTDEDRQARFGTVQPDSQTAPGGPETRSGARTAARTAPGLARTPENGSTGRSAPRSVADAANGRSPGRSGRRYDPAAMNLAHDLVGALAPLRAVRPGRIETALRRFVRCSEPWTVDDVVEAFDQHNARLGRAPMTREDCRRPIAWFNSMLRDLDVDADHPRIQSAFHTASSTGLSTQASHRSLDPCRRPDCDRHGWIEVEADGRTVLTQCPDCPPSIRTCRDDVDDVQLDEYGAAPF